MNMKKLFFTIYMTLLSLQIFAAKAHSLPIVVTQPDGTRLTVILHGDENISWYTAVDGTLLVKTDSGYYTANVTNGGSLEATRQLAHEPLARETAETNLSLAQDRRAFASYADSRLGQTGRIAIIKDESPTQHHGLRASALPSRIQIEDNSSLFPHVGSPRALVILVEFTDTTFTITDPKASFNDYLNNDTGNIANRGHGENKNYKGVRGYFKDMSFGQFTPEFDIVGPVKLQHPLAYYGAGSNDRMDRLIPDACTAVDDSVDFAKYDANNDGLVDLVYIINAGHSESVTGNSTDNIWPKSGYGSYGTYDGKRVYRYGVNNELNGMETSRNKYINGIGLFCHEFSHTMGLPDIYATQGSTGFNKDDFGMEYWDLMDGGEYVRSGRYPTAYTAWEREVMGWMSVDTLTDTTHVAMATIDSGDSLARACKVINDSVKNEAFYLQNIQQEGWNYGQPGHGMLVYRVSYAKDNVALSDRPNNGIKPRIVIVPADGKVGAAASYANDNNAANYYADMAGDTYPGTTHTDSIMSFKTYSDSTITKPILNIAEEDGMISFDFLAKRQNPTMIGTVKPTLIKQDNRIYSLTGQYIGTNENALRSGIYIIGGKKVAIK